LIYHEKAVTGSLEKKPSSKRDADSGPKMVTQPSGAQLPLPLLNTQPERSGGSELAASSLTHPRLLLTTVLERLLRYCKSLALTSGELICH